MLEAGLPARRWEGFYTPLELEYQPSPGWLIDGFLARDSLTCLYGQPGVGKSFLAQDWALTVASGLGDWMGQPAQDGQVIYIAGEGSAGLTKRIGAWRASRSLEREQTENLLIRVEALNLSDADEAAQFLARLQNQGISPALIIVDTLSRCFGGADENSGRDMAKFIANLDLFRAATGATVLVVHHSGKSEGRGARGHSALLAAIDTSYELRKAAGGTLMLTCDKQRNARPPDKREMRLVEVGESAVLSKLTLGTRTFSQPTELMPRDQLHALRALELETKPTSRSTLCEAVGASTTAMGRTLTSLVALGYVTGNGERPNSPKYGYLLTPAGRSALAHHTQLN
jgi:hypothetical protein